MNYFAVLDFEATCVDGSLVPEEKKVILNQEIIEFPIVLLRATDGEVVGIFHEYVRPVYNSVLTSFCTELTGIEQKTVDKADTFPGVWKRAQQFLEEYGATADNTIFVTCGNWDLEVMLPKQMTLSHRLMKLSGSTSVKIPLIFRSWLNIKKEYERLYYTKVKSMTDMLEQAKLKLLGRHHSGIDDATNIANVLKKMIGDGYGLVAADSSVTEFEEKKEEI